MCPNRRSKTTNSPPTASVITKSLVKHVLEEKQNRKVRENESMTEGCNCKRAETSLPKNRSNAAVFAARYVKILPMKTLRALIAKSGTKKLPPTTKAYVCLLPAPIWFLA